MNCGAGSRLQKTKMLNGFQFNGIASGIKKNGAKDLGLIYSEVPAAAAGVFTTNRVKAAPVLISQKRMRSGTAQAILVNSGNANACTGDKGMKAACQLSTTLARKMKIKEEMILVSSTGVIGVHLPVERIQGNIPTLVDGLSPFRIGEFAQSIRTTDTFPKIVMKEVEIGNKQVEIWGVAKGAGMVMPNMGTMLAFIMSTASVYPATLRNLLKEGVDQSFNRITVDGETSTNDMVLMLTNGKAGNSVLTEKSRELKKFRDYLFSLLFELSQMVVRDGEGATKLVEIRVEKAGSVNEARTAAFAVANSSLVKTAFYGEEVNWGRIMATLGRCGVAIDPGKVDISFGKVKVVKNGVACGTEEKAQDVVKQKEFMIVISLNRGKGSFQVSTTDLTPAYVVINSSYRS
jgi:glutamate N-acetyltransferase/amino-acid N-acetyltransferase